MEPYDRPSSNASGAAAVRQPEQPASAPGQEQTSPDEREARVAELREEYRRGTYQIDAAELSSSIVDKHLKK